MDYLKKPQYLWSSMIFEGIQLKLFPLNPKQLDGMSTHGTVLMIQVNLYPQDYTWPDFRQVHTPRWSRCFTSNKPDKSSIYEEALEFVWGFAFTTILGLKNPGLWDSFTTLFDFEMGFETHFVGFVRGLYGSRIQSHKRPYIKTPGPGNPASAMIYHTYYPYMTDRFSNPT